MLIKNKYILIRNLAALFILGNQLYWIFPFPPILWRISLVLLSVYALLIDKRTRTPFEKTVLLFAIFNLFHFVISCLWITPSTTQIGNILCVLLPISLFALLGEKGVMTERFFSVLIVNMTVSSIFAYYHGRQLLLIKLNADYDAEFTNNFGGYFLFLLPMIFFLKRQWQQIAVLGICIFYLLLSAKRGNILAAIFPVVLIVRSLLKDNKKRLGKSLMITSLIVLLGYLAYDWFITNDYLMYRLEQTREGDSSGRDHIYAMAWQAWYNADNSFLVIPFGNGFDGTIHHPLMDHMRAHNDWLEILVDYGLLGAALYFSIFVTLFRLAIKEKDKRSKLIMISVLMIWFSKTLYSMAYSEENMGIMMVSLGTIIGQKVFVQRQMIKK